MFKLVAVAAVVLVFAGCSDEPDSQASSSAGETAATTTAPVVADDELPGSIECLTQYRPDADTLEGSEEPTLTVERTDGLLAEPETVDFPTMTLSVEYVGDAPEGRYVGVAVTTAAGDPVTRSLYQLGDVPLEEINFAGGHGFTGLQYVSHDDAMLQVSCKAVP